MMRTIILSFFYLICLEAKAECPSKITHEQLAQMKNDKLIAIGGMNYGSVDSSVNNAQITLAPYFSYTEPELINEENDHGLLICEYQYSGKVTGRETKFKIAQKSFTLPRNHKESMELLGLDFSTQSTGMVRYIAPGDEKSSNLNSVDSSLIDEGFSNTKSEIDEAFARESRTDAADIPLKRYLAKIKQIEYAAAELRKGALNKKLAPFYQEAEEIPYYPMP